MDSLSSCSRFICYNNLFLLHAATNCFVDVLASCLKFPGSVLNQSSKVFLEAVDKAKGMSFKNSCKDMLSSSCACDLIDIRFRINSDSQNNGSCDHISQALRVWGHRVDVPLILVIWKVCQAPSLSLLRIVCSLIYNQSPPSSLSINLLLCVSGTLWPSLVMIRLSLLARLL